MARYTKDQFLKDLALYTAGATIGAKNSVNFLKYAARSGINLAGMGARRAAIPAARGIGRGLMSLSPQGRLVLAGLTAADAYDRGLLDAPIQGGRDLFVETVAGGIEQLSPYMPQSGPPPGFEGFGPIDDFGKGGRDSRGGAPTQHNQAVRAGMKALKASKYDGPKGKLRKPSASFSKVNKTISKLKKRKKVARTGATGVIARAVKKYT